MGTLQIKKVTPRVIANRIRRPNLVTWAKFEVALKAVHRDNPEVLKAIPRTFWISQLNLWNKGYRGSQLHRKTYEAAEHLSRFPMGH